MWFFWIFSQLEAPIPIKFQWSIWRFHLATSYVVGVLALQAPKSWKLHRCPYWITSDAFAIARWYLVWWQLSYLGKQVSLVWGGWGDVALTRPWRWLTSTPYICTVHTVRGIVSSGLRVRWIFGISDLRLKVWSHTAASGVAVAFTSFTSFAFVACSWTAKSCVWGLLLLSYLF